MILELRVEDKKLIETLVDAYEDDLKKVVEDRIKYILENDNEKIDMVIKKYLIDDAFIKKCIKDMVKYQSSWIIDRFADELQK